MLQGRHLAWHLLLALWVGSCARSGFVDGFGNDAGSHLDLGVEHDAASNNNADMRGAGDAGLLGPCGNRFGPAGTVEGLIFEDLDYAGGAGRPATPTDRFVPAVTVELYTTAGLVASTTTDDRGRYRFDGLGVGNYQVRVVTATLGDLDSQPAQGFSSGYDSALASQVYECNGRGDDQPRGALGGDIPTADDTSTPAGAGPGNVSVRVLLTEDQGLMGVNFGFSYQLVVNTNDSGPGSLRQFLLNANAIAGPNHAYFSIPDGTFLQLPRDPGVVSGVASISLQSALPEINDAGTHIDGATQTAWVGDSRSQAPEVRVQDTFVPLLAVGTHGLVVRADRTRISAIELRNFSTLGASAIYAEGVDALQIEDCLVADSSDPADGNGGAIKLFRTTRTLMQRNQISGSGRDGVLVEQGSALILKDTRIERSGDDGFSAEGADASLEGVTIVDSGGNGLELGPAAVLELIRCEVAGSGSDGLDCSGGGSSPLQIRESLFRDNAKAGVHLKSGGCDAEISRTRFLNNTQLGIDLGTTGVTSNDLGDGDSGPSDLLNFPVLARAELTGEQLRLTGEARPGSRLEFFRAAPNAAGFGQAERYLGGEIENCGSDCQTPSGDRSSAPGSVDSSAAAFDVTIAVTGLAVGDWITATATDAQGNTSEFAANLAIVSP